MIGVSPKSVDSVYRRWRAGAALALFIGGLTPTAAQAYTAAGDRNFPALLIVPQIAPSDALWGSFSSLPMNASQTAGTTRQNLWTGDYAKTITERLGIQLQSGLVTLDRVGRPSATGGQNLNVLVQYEAILDLDREFVLSVGVEQNFGGSGDQHLNSDATFKQSATQPSITFGKGLGESAIGYLRPLAVTGFTGYQIAEGAPPRFGEGVSQRPNTINAGFSIQYSLPYLVSKVANVDLPSIIQGLTPMTEVAFSTPVGPSRGQKTTVAVAPGFSYSEGRGWELGIEAIIPANKATGRGLGVIAQLVIQLDYLLPDSIVGRPIFAPR
jgi:hypothetical protein